MGFGVEINAWKMVCHVGCLMGLEQVSRVCLNTALKRCK